MQKTESPQTSHNKYQQITKWSVLGFYSIYINSITDSRDIVVQVGKCCLRPFLMCQEQEGHFTAHRIPVWLRVKDRFRNQWFGVRIINKDWQLDGGSTSWVESHVD